MINKMPDMLNKKAGVEWCFDKIFLLGSINSKIIAKENPTNTKVFKIKNNIDMFIPLFLPALSNFTIDVSDLP
jgi:hypothetical protein